MRGPRVRRTLGALVLAALAGLPYLATLSHPLLRDDRTLLDNDWLIREAGPAEAFAHHYWHGSRHDASDLYRPLTVLSLAWNARWRASAGSFRAVNVALHALCTVIAGWTLLRLFRRAGVERAGPAAWCGAALFAVHPLASEAVLFAVGRADVASLALGLLGFAVLLGDGGAGRVAIAAIAFFAALGFKESAACWPLVLAGWAFVERRDPVRRRRALAGLAAASGALAAFVAARAAAVGWGVATPPWVDNPLVLVDGPTRVANAGLLFARYLGKIAWPATLSVEYGFDQIAVVAPWPWGVVGACGVALAWTAAAVALRRMGPAGPWLWTFIPLTFAVTGNVGFCIGVMFAERLAYPAVLGACGIAGLALARLPVRTGIVAAIAAGLVLAAGARTAYRGRDLAGHRELVAATAAASPRAVKALSNDGRELLRSGRPREALDRFERALAIWPDYPGALALAADAWQALGDPVRAQDYRRRADEAWREFRADPHEGPDRRPR